MNETAWLRPAWTPLTIALMVIGFIIYWPIGLVMLAYIVWGDRINMPRSGEMRQKAEKAFGQCRRSARRAESTMSSSGNAAFDEWRRNEMERIEAERRKLDEMRADFDNYMRELKKARDREEFERFMREHGTKMDRNREEPSPSI